MAANSDGAPGAPGAALGERLHAYRTRALLTQEQLAGRAGVSVRTISNLERGLVHRPLLATARLLAEALDLNAQERETLIAAVPAAPAAPVAVVALPGCQLPMEVAGFTGRAASLAQLDGLLAGAGQGQAHTVMLSTIAGTAGVGKTALAVHWAHRVRDRFPDGQMYVNLHGYAPGPPISALEALAQLLQGLGVAADEIPVEVEAAAGRYRSLLAGRRILIVLDNARDAEQVRPLLPGSPGGVVVVTSRDRLTGLVASHGAHRLALDVLAPAEAVTLLTRILGQERATAELEATTELASACGLLPLALRIAAANLACHPEWSVAGYVARLREDDRLDELTVDGDPGIAVQAAFDRSYATLDPADQHLFRLLGLVPGLTFTAPAAAALAGLAIGQAQRAMDRLAGAHLVEPCAPGRFAFHDLLRRYARRRTEDDDDARSRQGAVERLLAWYLHTSDAAAELLYPEKLRLPVPDAPAGLPLVGFAEHAAALAWLDAERANLVAAVQQAAECGQRQPAWLLADTLRTYFWRRRHMVDWLAVGGAGRRAAQAARDLRAQAAAERNLGLAHQCLGDYAKAVEHYTSVVALSRQAGWVEAEASALADFGMVYRDLGQLEQAAEQHAQALALNRRIGYRAGQAVALDNLGDVYRELGRTEQAADHLTEALALHRQIGQDGQDLTLGTLGEVYRDLGRLDAAHEILIEALALAREVGNRYVEACDLHTLATVHRDAGRSALASELAEAALTLAREISEPWIEIDALNTLGSIHLRQEDHQQAAEHHRQALDLARRTSARYQEAEALLGLATAHRDHGQALDLAQQALVLATQSGYLLLQGQAHTALAAGHLGLEQYGEAGDHADHALTIHSQHGHRLGHARALIVLGQVLRHTEGADLALARWQEALALLTDIGAPEGHVRALMSACRGGHAGA